VKSKRGAPLSRVNYFKPDLECLFHGEKKPFSYCTFSALRPGAPATGAIPTVEIFLLLASGVLSFSRWEPTHFLWNV